MNKLIDARRHIWQIDNLALIIFIPLRITEEKPFPNLSILPIIPRLMASTLVDSLRMPSVDKQREILFQNITQKDSASML
jgi:hypothetical protein